ncbi:hypothetical protein KO507_05595 [Gilvimarinus agarilyticus]|uniref:hypothetical protein n=1 Tax=Gilvimarinus sp. 2_MG-2023 TaxID=3062666 RepID=UPI001C0A5AFD|nr:hypothetical protein [Gilvimarinus sp. 2_MG-2023]MBU2885235.1 hypothetical protein [Gilvimarinus agarilyticus]MDO6570132.1 hypothetical protein [Gilvimarinus sp. 2_MG-2023]
MDSKKLTVHMLMFIGVAYLIVTRYLVYVAMPEVANISLTKAIGANLAYFVIWTLAYFFSITSPRPVREASIGLLAVVISPLVMPLIGWILLLVIFFLRKKSIKQKTEDLAGEVSPE